MCAHAFGHYHLLFPVFYFLPVIVPCANNTFYSFVFFVCTLYILVHAMLIDHSYCNSIRISYRNNHYIGDPDAGRFGHRTRTMMDSHPNQPATLHRIETTTSWQLPPPIHRPLGPSSAGSWPSPLLTGPHRPAIHLPSHPALPRFIWPIVSPSSVAPGFLRPHSGVPRPHPGLSGLSPWPQLASSRPQLASAQPQLASSRPQLASARPQHGLITASLSSLGLSPATLGSFPTLLAPTQPLPVHGPSGMRL